MVVQSRTKQTSRWQDAVGERARQLGVPTAAGIVVLTAASTGVGWIVTRANGAAIAEADLRFARDLVAGRTPTLNDLTAAATYLADSTTVAVLWVGAMAFAAQRTKSWTIPAFLLATIGGEKLTYLLTSLAVGRARPDVASLGEVYATHSFPSGHVGSAIVLYGGIVTAFLWHEASNGRPRSWLVQTALGSAVAGVTVLVAFSRMYRGHHFLSDVIWGAVLGVTWLAIGWRFGLRAARR